MMLAILNSYVKGKNYDIINCTKRDPSQIQQAIEEHENDATKIIYVQKTIANYNFFNSLDKTTIDNNKYYIQHNGNYATWLSKTDLSNDTIFKFLNQPKNTNPTSVPATEHFLTEVDGIKISLVSNIKIL